MKRAWIARTWGLLLVAMSAGACSSGVPDEAPIVGRHSYVVSWTLTHSSDSSQAVGLSPHQFTMIVDADAGEGIVGEGYGLSVYPFTGSRPAELRFTKPVGFYWRDDRYDRSVTFNEMTLALGVDDRYRGTARGTAWSAGLSSDIAGPMIYVTMKLAGEPDAVPPTLTVSANGAVEDPFASRTLVASEPLPSDARPVLVSGDGATMALVPHASVSETSFLTSFDFPATLLFYGQTYRVTVDGITDFAGLPATESPTFTTSAAPPLVPEDGFESATGTTLAGAQLVTSADAPTISGARSLYIPPGVSTWSAPRPPLNRLALRLAVAPGDTVIRFTYRVVDYGSGSVIHVGSEGGKRGSTPLAAVTQAMTPVTLAGASHSLSPIATAEIPLPDDVGDEVVLAEIAPATWGPASLPASGLLIDDLRVE